MMKTTFKLGYKDSFIVIQLPCFSFTLLTIDEENQTHGLSNGGNDSGGNLSSTDSHFDDYDDIEYEDESDEYNGGGIISHKYGNSLRPRPYNSPGTPYTPVYCMYIHNTQFI